MKGSGCFHREENETGAIQMCVVIVIVIVKCQLQSLARNAGVCISDSHFARRVSGCAMFKLPDSVFTLGLYVNLCVI